MKKLSLILIILVLVGCVKETTETKNIVFVEEKPKKDQSLEIQLAALKKKAAKDPKNAVAHASLARCYARLGNIKEAIVEFEKAVKLRPENIQGTLAFLEKTWKKFSPGYPFNFAFLDESIQVRYQTEIKMGHGITSMAYIAILLSCMGVFGLSLYSIEEKKKEVGIRRVLGASAREIIIMISKRFIRAVFLSFLVSLLATLYINMKWLQKFAYRTNIGIAPFVFSASLTLIITLLTISYQTIKAATANPVDSLRYE